jgi:hypothetical protein
VSDLERLARALMRNDQKYAHYRWESLAERTRAMFRSDAAVVLQELRTIAHEGEDIATCALIDHILAQEKA